MQQPTSTTSSSSAPPIPVHRTSTTTTDSAPKTVIQGPNRPVPSKTMSAPGGGFLKFVAYSFLLSLLCIIFRLGDYNKTGMASFVLGQYKGLRPPPSESVQIYISSDGSVHWRPKGQDVSYELTEHGMSDKLGGLKKFIEYTISDSVRNWV